MPNGMFSKSVSAMATTPARALGNVF